MDHQINVCRGPVFIEVSILNVKYFSTIINRKSTLSKNLVTEYEMKKVKLDQSQYLRAISHEYCFVDEDCLISLILENGYIKLTPF